MASTYKREPLWYKDAIIYELNIKGFKDSTGTGIGDFKGLISKLDYLQDLGVTAIWILPFYPSPLRDDGYDISDYYTISEKYGNLDDFKLLLDEAHRRNLKVITELVINHTSDQHAWFQRARRAPVGSIERDYYVWSDDPNKYKDVRIIFQDFETSNWTWDAVAKQYYWHRFYSHQPDLNYDNPAVQEEIFKILDYWTSMGIDGFRLDAIPYLYEREDTNSENLPETHAFLKKLRKFIDERYDNVLFLAEANMWPEDSASYFGDGDECHMNYHFPLMPRMYMSLKMEDRHPITDIFEQTPEIPKDCQWATFLRNHDELTLEMVTDEERDYMRKHYAADPKARINLGIRRRLAPLLDNDRSKIELMNILLFSLPGTPVLYYGDEIGMGDNYYLGDRDGVRTPMQWNANQNAGFSEANPQSLYLPVIIDPEYDYKYVNVERQQKNTNSLLWWTKRTLAIRQKFKAFGRGSIEFLAPSNPKILAFVRKYETEEILVVINLSRFVEGVYIDLSHYQQHIPVEIFGDSEFPKIESAPYFISMAPHGYYWFQLKPIALFSMNDDLMKAPEINAASFEALASHVDFASKVLAKYLSRISWFGNKDRKIERIVVLDSILLTDQEHQFDILIVEVFFRTGTPELFQIPITFKAITGEDDILEKNEVIGVANITGIKGLIMDAFYNPAFRLKILNSGKELAQDNKIVFSLPNIMPVTKSEMRRSTIQYTAVAYPEDYYLKFYRRIDIQPNPDYEINHWLTKESHLSFVPQLLGSIFYRAGKYNTSLAVLQPLIAHQGYAWNYIMDALKRLVVNLQVNTIPIWNMPQSIFEELSIESLSDDLKSLVDYSVMEKIQKIAQKTAHMHLALMDTQGKNTPNFEPELFSLHYQRSLFAALKALVRSTITELKHQLSNLPIKDQLVAKEVIGLEQEAMKFFSRIYIHKFEAIKIRIHGNYHLEQIMLIGDDIMIDDFDGTFDRPFSERRLRRSPLIDVATMLRSIQYATTLARLELPEENKTSLINSLTTWQTIVCSFFLNAYKAEIAASGIKEFIPNDKEDFKILFEVLMLERAFKELHYELNYHPERATVPMQGILDMLKNRATPSRLSTIWGLS